MFMDALCLSKKSSLEVSQFPMPAVLPDEVLIRVNCCGICGSDLKIVSGIMGCLDNIVLGHEFSGVITSTGNKARRFKIGDMVVADPTLTCGNCEFCLDGKQNLCKNLGTGGNGELGVNINGAFAAFVKIRESNVYKLSDNISFEEATLVEPLACILNGFNRLNIKKNQTACIIGLGPTGLIWAELFRLRGIKVFGVEKSEFRCAFAQKFGITICQGDESNGFNFVIDSSGQAFELGVRLVKPAGKLVLFGMSPGHVEKIEPFLIAQKNVDILGVNMDSGTFKQAIKLLPRIRGKDIITHKFGLKDYREAFEVLGYDFASRRFARESTAVKVVICP